MSELVVIKGAYTHLDFAEPLDLAIRMGDGLTWKYLQPEKVTKKSAPSLQHGKIVWIHEEDRKVVVPIINQQGYEVLPMLSITGESVIPNFFIAVSTSWLRKFKQN